jgi:hypothetical protein
MQGERVVAGQPGIANHPRDVDLDLALIMLLAGNVEAGITVSSGPAKGEFFPNSFFSFVCILSNLVIWTGKSVTIEYYIRPNRQNLLDLQELVYQTGNLDRFPFVAKFIEKCLHNEALFCAGGVMKGISIEDFAKSDIFRVLGLISAIVEGIHNVLAAYLGYHAFFRSTVTKILLCEDITRGFATNEILVPMNYADMWGVEVGEQQSHLDSYFFKLSGYALDNLCSDQRIMALFFCVAEDMSRA